MRKLIVTEQLTLDGVMQAPGDPDEDRRGGFEHGGWHLPYFDEVFMEMAGESMSRTVGFLFGRRTYEVMARFWPHAAADDPFAVVLNGTPKYVASTTLHEPLDWEKSTLLEGNVAEAVKALKQEPGEGHLVVLGSGELVRSLMPHDLIDEYVFTIDPLVLGSGHRLFDGVGGRFPLQLVEVTPTSTGVIVATYRPA